MDQSFHLRLLYSYGIWSPLQFYTSSLTNTFIIFYSLITCICGEGGWEWGLCAWVFSCLQHTLSNRWTISPALICFLSKSMKQEITRNNNFLLFLQGCSAALRDGTMASLFCSSVVLFLALFEIDVRIGMASPNDCTELMPSLREICWWATA